MDKTNEMKRLTIILDSSQIVEYLKCPRLWFYRYVEHLYKKQTRVDFISALDKGSIIHNFLDLYYTLIGLHPTQDRNKLANEIIRLINTNTTLQESYGIDGPLWNHFSMRFLQYCLKYASNDFIPMIVKNTPATEIGFSKVLYEDADKLYIVEGRIDLLSETPVPCWVDHKTQEVGRDLYKLRPQFLTYSWATGINTGIINYFGFQKEFSDKTFRRQLIQVQDWMLAEWKLQMFKVFNDIAMRLETWRNVNPKTLQCAFFKHRNSCGGAFDMAPCMFTPLCEEQDMTSKLEEIKGFYFEKGKPWSPWN